ncbi:MAG: hypothetical protein ABI641_04395 [Caldimonas sp.]
MLNLSVHSLPSPAGDAAAATRTARGRLLMLLVLLVCTLPVVASYLAYFAFRPESRTNYSDLVTPPRSIPAGLALAALDGRPVAPTSLRGQWLLVVVAGGACDERCERLLWLQRQLHETLGREKDRVDKVWLVDDGVTPRRATLEAIGASTRSAVPGLQPASVLDVDRAALAAWLEPGVGSELEDHLYIVDPRGEWMMRTPPRPEPARLKRDVEKLLRASAGWDQPGR